MADKQINEKVFMIQKPTKQQKYIVVGTNLSCEASFYNASTLKWAYHYAEKLFERGYTLGITVALTQFFLEKR